MGKRYNWMCAGIAGSGSILYGYDAAVIAGTSVSSNPNSMRSVRMV